MLEALRAMLRNALVQGLVFAGLLLFPTCCRSAWCLLLIALDSAAAGPTLGIDFHSAELAR